MARSSRRRSGRSRTLSAALSLAGTLAVSGCGMVPRAKMEECHRLSQTLRTENTRLKDVALDLRAQNQDLSQRAVDDARRLTAQDEAVQRLEQSVQAYQAERDKLATAFEELKRQVRLSASPRPESDHTISASRSADLPEVADAVEETVAASEAPRPGREPAPAGALGAFALERKGEGWSYDPATWTLSAGSDALFEPGSARLKAGAESALAALREAVHEALGERDAVEVVGRTLPAADDVRRVNHEPEAGEEGESGEAAEPPSEKPMPGSAPRFLAAARAARVREALLATGALDAARVRLARPPRPGGLPGPADDAAVRLRVVHAPALDAAPETGR